MSGFTFPAETGTYDCVVEQEEPSGLGVTYDEIVLTCRVNAFVGQGWCLSTWGDRLGCGGESGCKQKDYYLDYPHWITQLLLGAIDWVVVVRVVANRRTITHIGLHSM
jgi:hypothetical protein